MATSESEVSVTVKKTCKYCKKNVTVGLTCELCEVTYHHSCAQRVKTCCDLSLQEKSKLPHSDTYTEQTFLKEENTLLRQIIKDKDAIIMDKETVIALLNNQIINLEEQLKLTKEDRKKQDNKNIVPPTLTKNIDDNKNTDKTKKTPTKQQNNRNRKQINLETLQNKQTSIMNHIINLNNDESSKGTPKQEISFKTASYKKKNRNTKIQIGEADVSREDETNGFLGREGVQKKVWLFIGRVKDHVTEEIVKKYLEKKTDSNNDIHVKEIDTYRKIADNKCFKVGLNFDLKDVVYTNSFWPRGVAVNRFDFRKEEKYLNRLRDANIANENFTNEPQSQEFI